MRRVLVTAPGKCQFDEAPDPELTAGHVKVRVTHCSVVMENVGIFTGKDPRVRAEGNPLYRGYPQPEVGEVIGEVIEVAPGVTDVKLGDRLANYAAYEDIQVIDPRAWTKIHTGVAPEAAISQGFAGTTLHAVRRAELQLGDDVLIIGAGPLGAMLVAWTRLAGAGRVIATDLYDLRLEVARKMGATHTVNGRTEKVARVIEEITEGNGPDVVFDAGNVAATFPLALEYARNEGKIVVLSWHTQPITIEDITRDFYHKELKVIATRAQGPAAAYRSPYVRWTGKESQRLIARLMGEGRFDPSPIVTDKGRIEDIETVMRELERNPSARLKTLLSW